MAKTFEEQISELENIVSELEKGEAGLDRSLELFEEGIKLTKSCQKILDTAEKKVKVLLAGDNGEMTEEDFGNEQS